MFHDHVLEDGVVGVEGHLGGDQASEVGGQAEEGEQREAEEVLASSQCEVWSGHCYHLLVVYLRFSMSEHLIELVCQLLTTLPRVASKKRRRKKEMLSHESKIKAELLIGSGIAIV